MIRAIKAKYWKWKNLRWLKKHGKELEAKYSDCYVLIDKCKDVAASETYLGLPWDLYNKKDGCICCITPVNLKLVDKGIVVAIW